LIGNVIWGLSSGVGDPDFGEVGGAVGTVRIEVIVEDSGDVVCHVDV